MNLTRRSFTRLIATLAVWFTPAMLLRAADPPPPAARKPLVPELKIEKYLLDNGLTVILHEDHKTPLVAINIVYNVGSKDDKPGRTGLAHLLEHMMFEGSLHSDQHFDDALSKFVDPPNASTRRDRTVHHETVTTDALERALWLEADRMGFLLPVLTEDKLDVVRNIVKNVSHRTPLQSSFSGHNRIDRIDQSRGRDRVLYENARAGKLEGYTYGLFSEFLFRQGPARFVLTGPMQTSATAESLIELMKEMTDLAGTRALDDDDIAVIEASQRKIMIRKRIKSRIKIKIKTPKATRRIRS